MKPLIAAAFLGLTWLAFAGCLGGVAAYQPPRREAVAGDAREEVTTRLQRTLDEAVDRLGIPGLQATVLLGDGTRWTGISGHADPRRMAPLLPDAAFRVGSVTKLFTATLALQLVDDGLLSLDDPLARWLPAYPNASHITIRQLLSHRSGAAEVLGSTWVKVRSSLGARSWSPEELLDRAARLAPGLPGTGFSYSNTNYILLGVVCEKVTGKHLAALIRERIADPLGLSSTRLVPYDGPPAGLVTGYDRDMVPFPGLYELEPSATSWATVAYGAGALVSTTEELVRFLDALLQRRSLLREATFRAMLAFEDAPMVGTPEQRGYGLGMAQLQVGGIEHWGHAGVFIGFTAIALHAPSTRLTIAVAGNLSTLDVVALVAALERAAHT